MSPLIKFEQVTKIYGSHDSRVVALDAIDLTIDSGEMVAIIGSSGSGKSTLLNLLGLLDRPSGGQYYLDGVDVASFHDSQLAYQRNQHIGFVFQSFLLIPKLTVIQNVMLPLLYRNQAVKVARAQAEQLLTQFGIIMLQHKPPNQLSGGQKQRVALCRALITDPKIILADEPTGALDSKNSERVMETFFSLHQRQARTFIIVTHDPVVAECCQRIISVCDGRIIGDRRQGASSCS